MAAGDLAIRALFRTEAAWPFLLRTGLLEECREFLNGEQTMPRALFVSGRSGTGKSFFVRELMAREAAAGKKRLGVYLDTPPSGLEAAAFFENLAGLLRTRRIASRDTPSFVDHKTAASWLGVSRGRLASFLLYAYGVERNLVALIPIVGRLIRAFLPPVAPIRPPASGRAASLQFLLRRSRSQYTLLAIDNVQFLPVAIREMLAAELADAGAHFRLVLIERVFGEEELRWRPAISGAGLLEVELPGGSLDDVKSLVRAVMPEVQDCDALASVLFRRSEGNLKSVWYQLRLVSSRRSDQEAIAGSYEDVILALPARDQAVLRFVVFTVGGLTIANLVSLLRATDLQLPADLVTVAIADLAALGLLVVNGASADRVRVEHELVAQVVNEITPEDEKLDLHSQTLTALSRVLAGQLSPLDAEVLSDRLLGIASGVEMRQSPYLLSHAVHFIRAQSELERYSYLATLSRDSVCWDVLDVLPDTTIRSFLDAIQKSALFDFGLVIIARLKQLGDRRGPLASLYEAKYLVQLFRYDEAAAALEYAGDSKEKRAVAFNVMLNLTQDRQAAEVVEEILLEIQDEQGGEQDYLILRNSAHLFPPQQARRVVETSIEGFRGLGRRFGAATAVNNLGIVDLAAGRLEAARQNFEAARRELAALDSPEIYEPLVNLSAVALLRRDLARAKRLLAEAREAAPRSLQQDAAMLDLNEVVLMMCAGEDSGSDFVSMTSLVAEAARRTRDLRFVDMAAWLSENVAAANASRRQGSTSLDSRIADIRANGRVPLEIFLSVRLYGRDFEVPFVLSPHWRY